MGTKSFISNRLLTHDNSILENQLKKVNNSQYKELYKELKQAEDILYHKNYELNGSYDYGEYYDDQFLINLHPKNKGNFNYKVSQIQIYYGGTDLPHNIVFCYKPINEEAQDLYHEIQGFQPKVIDKNHVEKMNGLVLDDDEFLVQIGYQCGFIVDSLYFKTSKGRSVSFLKNGHNEQSLTYLNAPSGYHLSNFRIGMRNLQHNELNIGYLGADVFRQKIKYKTHGDSDKIISLIGNQMRSIMNFLTVGEILNVFQTCKYFSELRFNKYVQGQLSKRILYFGFKNQRKYVKNIIKSHQIQQNGDDEQLYYLLKQTKNILKNPYSKETYSIQKENSLAIKDKTFNFSFEKTILTFKRKLSEILNKDQIKNLQNGKAALIFGAKFQSNGPLGIGYMNMEIISQNQQIILKKEDELKVGNANWKMYNHIYYGKNQDIDTVSIGFGGKDTVYWAGHYGPKIQGVFLRYLPMEYANECTYFDYAKDIQQRLWD